MDFAQRCRREGTRIASGNTQPVRDIGTGFGRSQRRQVVARGDARGELAQVVACQQRPEFGLADQHDAQQLVLVRLEVGEQAHLFQHFRRQVLRLVNDQQCAPAAGVGVEQIDVERIHQRLDRILFLVGDMQLVADRGDELQLALARIDDHRHVHVRQFLREQGADHGRLAGADFAGELHETASRPRAVQQMAERLLMARRQIQISRVGRDRERLFAQAEEVQVQVESAFLRGQRV